MKQWKRKTLAVGLAALMMIPGTAYGMSFGDIESELDTYREQLIRLFEYWETFFNTNQDGGDHSDGPVSNVASQMLSQVNQERRSAGLSELSLSQELTKVAQVKAEDMRDSGYFSHTSPTYGSPFDMIKDFGIHYKTAGENIAKGQRSVEQVMDDWMDSSGHRANILNGDFTKLGVGYCTDNAGNGYWIQMFVAE